MHSCNCQYCLIRLNTNPFHVGNIFKYVYVAKTKSHLNLDPDPCTGATLVDGIMMPNDLPGHGASFTTDN